jgi:hypothetical protein
MPSRTRQAVISGVALVVAINLGILALRMASLAEQGDLISTTLGEGQVLYPIWKILNAHPLYEWPYAENYGLTLYNAGFYHLYAFLIGLSGRSADFLWHARAITAAFAAAGVLVFYALSRTLFVRLNGRPPTRDERVLHVGLALLLWCGTGTVSWWVVAARPDIGGLVFVTAGLLFLIVGGEKKLVYVALSALAFFAAWAMKQSLIGVVVGVMGYLLVTGQVRRLLVFGAIYFGLIATFLAAGSEQYRASIIGAASIHGIDLRQSTAAFARIWISNPLLLVPAAWLLLDARLRARRELWLILLVCLTANGLAFVTLGKEGAERNHAFEAMMVVALAATAALNRDHLVGRRRAAVLLSAVAMAGMGVAQVAFADRFGKITLADPAEYAAKDTMRRFMTELPKPIYIRDEILAQPWYTTDNQYPAPVMDHSNYRDAVRRGVVTGPGMLEWADQRRFATFILDPRDPFVPRLQHTYVLAELPPEIAALGVHVYVRPDHQTH